MAEQVLNTLNTKRHEIEAYIGSLERDLEQARRDLSAILAATKVFSADGPKVTAYMNLSRLFPRFELAKEALEASPAGLSTIGMRPTSLPPRGWIPATGTSARPLRTRQCNSCGGGNGSGGLRGRGRKGAQ